MKTDVRLEAGNQSMDNPVPAVSGSEMRKHAIVPTKTAVKMSDVLAMSSSSMLRLIGR